MNEIRYFSMFTGVGGFELGIERATNNQERQHISEQGSSRTDSIGTGHISNSSARQERGNGRDAFSCVGFSEIDKYSSELLKQKFPSIKNWGDATKINPSELPDFDMLCGGFPCQAFSIAGKRRGFEDTRGTLFFDVARIIEVKRPKIVLLENVKGLLNHNKGETFKVIIQTLSELGYDVQWMVLNSKFFGVPQNRERVFIIGSLRGERRPEILPFRTDSKEIVELQGQQIHPSITGAIGRQGSSKEYKSSLAVVNTIKARHLADANGSYINECQQFPQIEVKGTLNSEGWEKRHENIRRVYGKDGISPPLNNWSPILNGLKIRRLTPTECLRLQGFPDDYFDELNLSDTQKYKMMGNAVTVNVIKAIASKLLNYFGETNES